VSDTWTFVKTLNETFDILSVQVRFSKPVIPGQTLVTEMWAGDANNRVHFQTRVKETGQVAISSAYVDFNRPITNAAAKTSVRFDDAKVNTN
jgi:3-hydroxyacyl-CoA dehydrogenase/3a,7a,12a-trihydroxy-5b-cholest-24-enoyl-CoA hydratase